MSENPPRPARDAAATGRIAARGAGLLVIRQAFVSLVMLGGVLVLSVLLEPSQFALYGFVSTVILVAAAVGDLGLGASLIRAQSLNPKHLSGSLALQLAFWPPICAAGTLAGSLLGLYGFSVAVTALLFGTLLLLSLQALPTALLERRMAFGRIAAAEVIQRLVFVGIAVALAATSPAQWSIPVAAAAAAAISYPSVMLLAGWRWPPRFARGEPLFRGFSSHWWQSRIANQLTYATYPLLGGILFTTDEVGLMVWALAVTSIPALLSPMVARAIFPATSQVGPGEQVAVFRPLFKILLLAGMPLVAILFACAQPLTQYIFGSQWLDGVTLLRLESITTLIGLALTPVAPLLFLALPARTVKWVMASWLIAVLVLAPVLAPIASFRAISIAQIAASAATLLMIERLLRKGRGYSLLRDMLPGLAGVAIAIGVGLPAASLADGALSTLAIGAGIGALQLGVAVLLGGGVDPRLLLTRVEGDAVAPDPAMVQAETAGQRR